MSVAVLQRQTLGEFGGPEPTAEPGPLPELLLSACNHALAAMLLVWPAFWNGFPLVFADTGTYLGQALMHYLGWDRPPFYSVFLLATDLRLTLWLPVLAQGLLLAHLFGLTLRCLGRTGRWTLPAAAAALAIGTPLPWFAAQLMPDVFTGMVLLALWLLGFRHSVLTPGQRWYLTGFSIFAIAAHQSHLPLALGLAAVGGAVLVARRGWRQAWRPTFRMAAPALVAALALVAVNAIARGRPSLSPYGSVFVATRLIYDGPGLAVARRECPAVGWKLCGVLDRLPGWHNGFLWNDDSPLQRELGGAEAWAPEAAALVLATLRAEPGMVLDAALRNTLEQLTMVGVGDGLEPWPPPHGPMPVVARFFPQEFPALMRGRQMRGLLLADARAFLPLHAAVLALAVLAMALMLLLRRQRLGLPALALGLMVLAALLGNAAVAGALSGPAGRYQARLVWLLPFAAVTLLAGLRLVPQPAPAGLRPRFNR